MSKYVVMYRYTGKTDEAPGLVDSHIDHLKKLRQEGILFLCGLLKENDGAMLILEADSFGEAEGYILRDPLVDQEFYRYEIYEFIEANEENNFLLEDV